MQSVASFQLFYSLATLVIMKVRPHLAEDKLDELVVFRTHEVSDLHHVLEENG